MPISGLCRVGVIFRGFDGMDAPGSPASRCHMVVVVERPRSRGDVQILQRFPYLEKEGARRGGSAGASGEEACQNPAGAIEP